MLEGRHFCRLFIGDSGVIKRKRAGEVSVAGDAMRISALPKAGERDDNNDVTLLSTFVVPHRAHPVGQSDRVPLQHRPDPGRDTDECDERAAQNLPIAFKRAEPDALKASRRADA